MASILWNQEVRYSVNNSVPLVTLLTQNCTFHKIPRCFFIMDHFTALPSTSRTSKWSLSFRFPHQNAVCISLLPHRCHASAFLILTDSPTLLIYSMMKNTNHEARCYELRLVFCNSFPVRFRYSPSTMFSDTSNVTCVVMLMRETMFTPIQN